MRGRRIWIVLAVAALGAVATVVAISAWPSGEQTVSPTAIAQAATTTGSAKGAALELKATMRMGMLSQPMSFTGSGVEDLEHNEARISMDMSQMAAASGGQLDPSDLKMEAIYAHQSMFMRSPLFEGKLPGGKQWMGIDLRRALEQQGVSSSMLTQQGNPTDYLRYLRGVSGKVTKVGTEKVRGVTTTHYRATADIRRSPGVKPEDAQRLVEMTGTSKVPMEIWIDAHHLIRRMRLQMDMKLPPNAGAAAGRHFSLDETVELYNFGPKGRIDPPPADDVYDATDVAAKGLQH
jgi:hypothetical protein